MRRYRSVEWYALCHQHEDGSSTGGWKYGVKSQTYARSASSTDDLDIIVHLQSFREVATKCARLGRFISTGWISPRCCQLCQRPCQYRSFAGISYWNCQNQFHRIDWSWKESSRGRNQEQSEEVHIRARGKVSKSSIQGRRHGECFNTHVTKLPGKLRAAVCCGFPVAGAGGYCL